MHSPVAQQKNAGSSALGKPLGTARRTVADIANESLGRAFGGRDELHRHAVDAIAETRWFRAVLEHVSEMAATTPAMHFRARHEPGPIGRRFHRIGKRLVKTWPTRSAFKFGLGAKERLVAPGAHEHPFTLLLVQWTGSGSLGAVLAQHVVLLGGE